MQTDILTDTRKKRGTKLARKTTITRARIGTEAVSAGFSTPVVVSEFLTTKQAAQYLNLSRQYLEAARYRGDGSGPPYVKLERAVRYRRSVLDAWMSAHDHSPDKPIYTE